MLTNIPEQMNENDQPVEPEAARELKDGSRNRFSFFSFRWNGNITENEDAPVLFSRTAVFFFTLVLSVLYGGIMMYMNLSRLRNNRGKLIVAAFTVLYIVLVFVLRFISEFLSMFTLFFNLMAGFILVNVLWEKLVGAATVYRPRSVKVPILIALGLTVLASAVVFYYLRNLP